MSQQTKIKVADWIGVDHFCQHHTLACIDGRKYEPRAGAPGGSMGEFLLLLAATEGLTQVEFEPKAVLHLFDAHIGQFRRFYMHTDEDTLSALRMNISHLPGSERYWPQGNNQVFFKALHELPERYRPLVLPRLQMARFQGCGHLRLMLAHPDAFGIRGALVEQALGCFFQRWWQHHPALEYEMLQGAHEEVGVVTVRSEGSQLPLVETPKEQYVINHDSARRVMQQRGVMFLDQTLPALGFRCPPAPALMEEIQRLAEKQLSQNVKSLTPHLPHQELRLTPPAQAEDLETRGAA